MTEPTDRDRELLNEAEDRASKAADRELGTYAVSPFDRAVIYRREYLIGICAAREEGRREERLRGNRSDDAITGEALAGLPEDQLSSKAAIAWLTEAARYFSARNTGGEDAAHWANVSNSIMCRRIADLLRNIPK